MKILMIDNYDSFTYNLVQYLRELTNTKITVVRNDEVPVDFVQDFDCRLKSTLRTNLYLVSVSASKL